MQWSTSAQKFVMHLWGLASGGSEMANLPWCRYHEEDDQHVCEDFLCYRCLFDSIVHISANC